MVKYILRLEGLAVFLISLYFYNQIGGDWLIFLLLVFLVDISMVGYIKGKSHGAITYNLVHNYILSLSIIFLGIISTFNWLTLLGLIILAHVGIDRFFGFGLKYKTNFKDTHIQKV